MKRAGQKKEIWNLSEIEQFEKLWKNAKTPYLKGYYSAFFHDGALTHTCEHSKGTTEYSDWHRGFIDSDDDYEAYCSLDV